MKTLMLALVVSAGLYAQTPIKPEKSRIDGTRGAVTVRAVSEINKHGAWTTKLLLSSPNTSHFFACLVYQDGNVRRAIPKVGTSTYDNLPTEIVFEVPIEVAASGSIIVYELMPSSIQVFDSH